MMRKRWLTTGVLALPLCAFGQTSNPGADLPSAPLPQASASLRRSFQPELDRMQHNVSPEAQTAASLAGQQLSLQDAEALALKQNPQISVGRLLALASQQVTREARSSLWPAATADLTGVDSHENSRITAGGLNNPILYERAAGGVNVSQLITDFGRTNNLVASANLSARAEAQTALATKEQILLEVHQAFFHAFKTQAVLRVAEETVSARRVLADQVGALARNKLKSDLDLSFANVNLAQAKLLLLDAQNNQDAALASLSAVLGCPATQNFVLVEDSKPMTAPPASVDALISEALATRPELLALDYQYRSAQKLKTAEHDLLFPTIRALGTVGGAPVRNDHLSSWYGAVGANVDIPIFNGFLYTARAREVDLRSEAARDRVLDLRNRIGRDVRTCWLAAKAAYERRGVTRQLLEQAQLALDLSQARYKLGLGSIVELSQAQLQATQAEIGNAQAGYDYRLALAVLRYETSGL